METSENSSKHMEEIKSLQVIKEMIAVSHKKIKHDGILFILWGWLFFYKSMFGYVERTLVLTFAFRKTLNYIGIIILLTCLIFTIYYLVKQRKKVKTYVGISLRYVWISLFVCMVLVNLIQFNVQQNINFELQQPIFMVLMAFAVTVTGGILRHKLIIIGGIVFGSLALTASYLILEKQLLIESIAWALAFIIPGHILFYNRNK